MRKLIIALFSVLLLSGCNEPGEVLERVERIESFTMKSNETIFAKYGKLNLETPFRVYDIHADDIVIIKSDKEYSYSSTITYERYVIGNKEEGTQVILALTAEDYKKYTKLISENEVDIYAQMDTTGTTYQEVVEMYLKNKGELIHTKEEYL